MTVQPGGARLCQQAEEALDALIDSGWNLEQVTKEHRPCAEKLLHLLDSACTLEDRKDRSKLESLIKSIMDRIPTEPVLVDDSADALDVWSQSGYQTNSVPRSLREQAEAHENFARLISMSVSQGDIQASDRLIDDTIQGIMDYAEASQPRDFGFKLRIRMTDLASLAALLLIAVSVSMPLLSTMRYESMRRHNESNFAAASVAFGTYATDHEDRLPVYTPSGELANKAMGQNLHWWMVGIDPNQSNSANLYTLTRLGYTPLHTLASPGNKHAVSEPTSKDAVDWDSFEQVSYSFRVERPDTPKSLWASRGRVVLTDRSPVTLKAYQRLPIDPYENSPNHDGRGQHALHGDGSVEWLTTPWLDRRDHVFLPDFVERLINPDVKRSGMIPLQGKERPGSTVDAFVGP
ncbi:MAG: hypothetical protein ED559_07190 [Phycisphaera sp.]|nr:MAG: hypothetical protein ED559_07190 [Phycisphaera sp.]